MGGAESKQRVKPLKYSSQLAGRPSVPGKPQLVPSDKHSAEPDVVTIRWEPPFYDGGSRIIGYLVEHRRTGSPHWVRSSPALVKVPELTLSGLEPGWRYQFRVSAQNTAGLSEPGELSDLLTVTLQRTAASAPFFVKELKDTVALENEKAELSVLVRGTPAPTIAWFKDGVEIFSSRSYRIVTDNEISTLLIHQAALSDEGEIKCSATNRVGYAVTRAKLLLEAPPNIRLPRQYEEGLLFEKDEVIRLKVSVAGRPVPKVSWQLNGEPVGEGGRYEATHAERYATLRVGEARRSDRGEYQVRAVNKLGEDVASFLVTVADRPVPPGRAKVVMTLGRSVTLSWSAPEDDGGCKIGNYIVEYYRLGWNMWLKAATCRQLTTTLGELMEGSEYKFRVKAENPYGVSEASPESDVVFIPDPKRGLLEPPEHRTTETEVAMDVWLEDKKRPSSASPTIDEQYGERKTKKKRGPVALPQSQRPDIVKELMVQTDKHSVVSEDSMSPPTTPDSYHPVIPKRHKKVEKIEIKKDQEEERELAKKLEEKRKVEEFKKFEERKKAEEKRAEELKKTEEQKKQDSSTYLPSSDLKKKKKEPRVLQSPMTPRIEHDHRHGSSELMLILLPHSRATTEERETSKRELFESSLALEGSDIAPPMSLSAPELGSGDPPELPLVRAAFSSTELLHERAMARFYQDMAQEESEASVKRQSSIQRRRSFGSRTRDIMEVTGSFQDSASSSKISSDKVEKPLKPLEIGQSKPGITQNPENSTLIVRSERKTFSRDSMDSVLSSEDPHRKSVLVQQTSEEDMEYEDSSFDEDEEDEYDEEEEEPATDENIDEEMEEELEEEEEEEFSLDEKRGSLYTSESEEEMRYSYLLEEDTYHSRNVNLKYNEDTMISAYESRGPLILGPVPQTSEQASTPNTEIKLKPILKRPPSDKNATQTTEEPEPGNSVPNLEDQKTRATINLNPEKRYEPNFSPVMPKPILKVREPSQERYSPVSQRKGAPVAGVETELNLESSNRTNIDEGSDYETGVKKKQVRIEEPEDVMARNSPAKQESDTSSTTIEEQPRQRTGSLGDEVDATKVLISHYSDIVAEYGRGKRPPKTLYLNYEALKAAAEKEEEENMKNIPEIMVNEPDTFEEVNTKEKEQTPVIEEKPTVQFESVTQKHITPTWQAAVDLKKQKSPSPEKKRSPSPRKKKRKALASVREDVVPENTEITNMPIRAPSPIIPPRQYTSTEKKVHSYIDYLMDLSLFLLACWLYLFKDERLSIPVLCLMIYRQAHEAFRRKMEALRNKLPKRIRFWRRD